MRSFRFESLSEKCSISGILHPEKSKIFGFPIKARVKKARCNGIDQVFGPEMTSFTSERLCWKTFARAICASSLFPRAEILREQRVVLVLSASIKA